MHATITALQPSEDKRATPRRTLHLDVPGTTVTGVAGEVLVRDLSESGLLLETSVPLSEGEVIAIDLPGADATPATVVWAKAPLFGCKFEHPVARTVLSAAQLRSTPVTTSDDAVEPAETFAARFNRLREDRGISIAEIAAQMKVSKPTVYNWEAGTSRPRLQRMGALAQALGVSRIELLRGEQEMDLAHTAGHASEPSAERPVWSGSGPVSQGARLQQLVTASKAQIAELAGTTSDKVRIIIEV
jgi:DNA-binding transcriptional regulator YiaG